MSDKLREALERKRSGYDEESMWLTFLLDAYTGGGGFQGSVRQPDVSWWGAAATRYAPFNSDYSRSSQLEPTYLDRFAREDDPKFKSRIAVAHYWNFVGPLTDLKLSYLLRKGFTPHNRPDELGEWREDVDGLGTSWEELRPLVALLAATMGWTPVLLDMDPAEPGMSRAQAAEAGVGRPRAIPLTPANLVDWSHDDGRWRWVKVRTDHVEHDDWMDKPVAMQRYAIWTPETVDVFEVRKREGKSETTRVFEQPQPHPFGAVPLTIFRHHRAPGDDIRGLPMHAGPAVASKRLFNLLSELDELLRSQTFAVLVLAMEGEGGEISLGTDNGLPLDPSASQKHYYMSPDPSSAEAYERRIEATIREGIYRPARVEFDRPTGQAVSGVARAYSFSQTNRAIADFAGEFARGEREMDGLAWAGLGREPAALDDYDVRAPGDFDVEDLTTEIDNVTKALTLQLGTEMETRLKKRVVVHFEPDMPKETEVIVDEQLAAIAEEGEQARAAMLEMGDTLRGGEGEPSDDDNQDTDEDEDE